MYINPFVAGVLATLLVEMIVVITISLIAYKKNHKEEK